MPHFSLSENHFSLLRNRQSMRTKRGLPAVDKSERKSQNTAVRYALPTVKQARDRVLYQNGGSASDVLSLISSKIESELDEKFPFLKRYPKIRESAGFIAFKESLLEFVKNSCDAGATYCEVDIDLNPYTHQLTYLFMDNGKKAIPATKVGLYDIEQAIREKSEKHAKHDSLGGKHSALAMAAAYVEKQGNGHLSLLPNPAGQGAMVKIVASSARAEDQYFRSAGVNVMLPIVDEVKARNIAKLKHQYHQQKRDLNRRYGHRPLLIKEQSAKLDRKFKKELKHLQKEFIKYSERHETNNEVAFCAEYSSSSGNYSSPALASSQDILSMSTSGILARRASLWGIGSPALNMSTISTPSGQGSDPSGLDSDVKLRSPHGL